METNKFSHVGWLAVIHAIVFPLMFILGIIEQGVAAKLFGIHKPIFGPSDVIGIIAAGIAIYTLWMFKKLLNEHYEYHDLDLLILIAIWWTALFQVIGLGLGLLAVIYWPVDEFIFAVTFLVFFVGAIITIGIVDILIAVKLLKVKENFSEYIRVFAYVTIAAGICEVSVFLTPIALILVPVTSIVLALIFFKDRHQVEYV